MNKKMILFAVAGLMMMVLSGCGYIEPGETITPTPDFFDGIYHGLIAPYTLLVRLFKDVSMYAVPNVGWLYDAGYLIGVYFSLPIGWLFAILALFY